LELITPRSGNWARKTRLLIAIRVTHKVKGHSRRMHHSIVCINHSMLHACMLGGGRHSYVAMISTAILSSPDNQLPLADIYAFIEATFLPQQAANDSMAWRNNVRHHLSVNDCFIKVGARRLRGRASFWAVHPDCIDHFRRGDYRRRRWTVRRGHRPASGVETSERYETMRQTISTSDELFAYLVSSGVFARLKYMHVNSFA